MTVAVDIKGECRQQLTAAQPSSTSGDRLLEGAVCFCESASIWRLR